jgi:hypothetical protein
MSLSDISTQWTTERPGNDWLSERPVLGCCRSSCAKEDEMREKVLVAFAIGVLGWLPSCGGAAVKPWPRRLSVEKTPPRVEDLRRYFNAEGLHKISREYRHKLLGDIKTSFVYYELTTSADGKVLTEYAVSSLQQLSATQSFRRYRLTDTGVHLLQDRSGDTQAKIFADLVFSWSPQSKPFTAYELEATAKASLFVMPLSVTAREKTMGVFDGYYRVTGAAGVAFESIRICEASGANISVNDDGLQAAGEKPLHTYYGLDFGRLATVRADDPSQYGETAALLVDGPPAR